MQTIQQQYINKNEENKMTQTIKLKRLSLMKGKINEI